MKYLIFSILSVLLIVGCHKDDYYQDTGLHSPNFKGNMLDYIDSRTADERDIFDTLRQVISIAGLEDDFRNRKFTYFATPDPCIGLAVDQLNTYLYNTGKDSVRYLDEINPEVWKRLLQGYMLNGELGLLQFYQIDTLNLGAYPGQLYQTLSLDELNVGSIYQAAVSGDMSIIYQGPRKLLISYLPGGSSIRWINVTIASSNIKPTNGVVHVVNYKDHVLGFSSNRFISLVTEYGINYK